jgi:hypothetical protein
MECNNDINSIIDIAKVADLFFFTDASFGFGMQIFEFLKTFQARFTEAYYTSFVQN